MLTYTDPVPGGNLLVAARGARLNVVEEGAGSPALVFLHGIGGSHTNWQPQMDAFAGDHRTVALDLRGFGGSEATPGQTTLAEHAADTLDLFERLGLIDPVVVGLSMGGMVAQAIAIAAPERIRAVVLCDTACELDDRFRGLLDLARAAVADGGMAAIGGLFLPTLFSPAVWERRDPCVDAFSNDFLSTDPSVFANGLGAIAALDHAEAVGRLQIPTLVVHGRLDEIVPVAHGERLAALVPGAELVVLDDCGHMSNMEQPRRFNEILAAFLARLR